ncbi:MAG: gliding-associated putative transporter substrate-binding component GldG [Dehalococcoidia bacterium]|nr:gliding-associated putative transporter substrate-binding component GldG [Dehalococcoidia bacterium]
MGRAPQGKGPDGSRPLTPRKLGLLLVEAGSILSLAGVVILAGGLVILLTIRELRTPALILVYLALLMLATSLVTHLPAVRKAVTARTGRYTTNTLVMVVSLLSILVLAGFISFENSYRMDLTATRQFTLARQTREVVKELKEPVEARGYFKPDDSRQELVKRRVDDFFYEFNRLNREFTYEFIDPDLKPSLARQDGVTQYPTIVFTAPESQGNPFRLTPFLYEDEFILSEQDLVASLLITTGTKQKTVYFTTGHGEGNTEDTEVGSKGFGFARTGLVGDSYRVCTINLKQAEAMPTGDPDQPCGVAEAAVLIIAGPTGSFLLDEEEKINDYLRNGGSVMFLVDDAVQADINTLFNLWGMNMMEGVIVDPDSSASGDPRSPILRRGQYNPDDPITQPLDDTFFTQAAAIQDVIKRAPEGLPPNPDEVNIRLTPLATTSLFSCVTTKADQSDCSGEEAVPGPHIIAMAVEALAPVGADPVEFTADAKVASIVVFGDSDFASNEFYFAFSNSDLFLNAVDWLTQSYELISIRAKPQVFRDLIITKREFDFIRYSSWFLLPVGVLMLAGIAWWRRR